MLIVCWFNHTHYLKLDASPCSGLCSRPCTSTRNYKIGPLVSPPQWERLSCPCTRSMVKHHLYTKMSLSLCPKTHEQDKLKSISQLLPLVSLCLSPHTQSTAFTAVLLWQVSSCFWKNHFWLTRDIKRRLPVLWLLYKSYTSTLTNTQLVHSAPYFSDGWSPSWWEPGGERDIMQLACLSPHPDKT